MTPDLARIRNTQTTVRAAPRWAGGDALRGRGLVLGRLGRVRYPKRLTRNPQVALLVFPRITSSPRIDRRDIGRFVARSHHISTLPVADQVRELQTALSVNKSELARILRVSRPTVYDWLDDGQPNADNVSRIQTVLRLLSGSRVSASNPLFPRFVRSAVEPGDQALLDLLCEETIAEANVREAIHRTKALGDAVDTQRKEREARLRVRLRGTGRRAAEGLWRGTWRSVLLAVPRSKRIPGGRRRRGKFRPVPDLRGKGG